MEEEIVDIKELLRLLRTLGEESSVVGENTAKELGKRLQNAVDTVFKLLFEDSCYWNTAEHFYHVANSKSTLSFASLISNLFMIKESTASKLWSDRLKCLFPSSIKVEELTEADLNLMESYYIHFREQCWSLLNELLRIDLDATHSAHSIVKSCIDSLFERSLVGQLLKHVNSLQEFIPLPLKLQNAPSKTITREKLAAFNDMHLQQLYLQLLPEFQSTFTALLIISYQRYQLNATEISSLLTAITSNSMLSITRHILNGQSVDNCNIILVHQQERSVQSIVNKINLVFTLLIIANLQVWRLFAPSIILEDSDMPQRLLYKTLDNQSVKSISLLLEVGSQYQDYATIITANSFHVIAYLWREYLLQYHQQNLLPFNSSDTIACTNFAMYYHDSVIAELFTLITENFYSEELQLPVDMNTITKQSSNSIRNSHLINEEEDADHFLYISILQECINMMILTHTFGNSEGNIILTDVASITDMIVLLYKSQSQLCTEFWSQWQNHFNLNEIGQDDHSWIHNNLIGYPLVKLIICLHRYFPHKPELLLKLLTAVASDEQSHRVIIDLLNQPVYLVTREHVDSLRFLVNSRSKQMILEKQLSADSVRSHRGDELYRGISLNPADREEDFDGLFDGNSRPTKNGGSELEWVDSREWMNLLNGSAADAGDASAIRELILTGEVKVLFYQDPLQTSSMQYDFSSTTRRGGNSWNPNSSQALTPFKLTTNLAPLANITNSGSEVCRPRMNDLGILLDMETSDNQSTQMSMVTIRWQKQCTYWTIILETLYQQFTHMKHSNGKDISSMLDYLIQGHQENNGEQRTDVLVVREIIELLVVLRGNMKTALLIDYLLEVKFQELLLVSLLQHVDLTNFYERFTHCKITLTRLFQAAYTSRNSNQTADPLMEVLQQEFNLSKEKIQQLYQVALTEYSVPFTANDNSTHGYCINLQYLLVYGSALLLGYDIHLYFSHLQQRRSTESALLLNTIIRDTCILTKVIHDHSSHSSNIPIEQLTTLINSILSQLSYFKHRPNNLQVSTNNPMMSIFQYLLVIVDDLVKPKPLTSSLHGLLGKGSSIITDKIYEAINLLYLSFLQVGKLQSETRRSGLDIIMQLSQDNLSNMDNTIKLSEFLNALLKRGVQLSERHVTSLQQHLLTIQRTTNRDTMTIRECIDFIYQLDQTNDINILDDLTSSLQEPTPIFIQLIELGYHLMTSQLEQRIQYTLSNSTVSANLMDSNNEIFHHQFSQYLISSKSLLLVIESILISSRYHITIHSDKLLQYLWMLSTLLPSIAWKMNLQKLPTGESQESNLFTLKQLLSDTNRGNDDGTGNKRSRLNEDRQKGFQLLPIDFTILMTNSFSTFSGTMIELLIEISHRAMKMLLVVVSINHHQQENSNNPLHGLLIQSLSASTRIPSYLTILLNNETLLGKKFDTTAKIHLQERQQKTSSELTVFRALISLLNFDLGSAYIHWSSHLRRMSTELTIAILTSSLLLNSNNLLSSNDTEPSSKNLFLDLVNIENFAGLYQIFHSLLFEGTANTENRRHGWKLLIALARHHPTAISLLLGFTTEQKKVSTSNTNNSVPVFSRSYFTSGMELEMCPAKNHPMMKIIQSRISTIEKIVKKITSSTDGHLQDLEEIAYLYQLLSILIPQSKYHPVIGQFILSTIQLPDFWSHLLSPLTVDIPVVDYYRKLSTFYPSRGKNRTHTADGESNHLHLSDILQESSKDIHESLLSGYSVGNENEVIACSQQYLLLLEIHTTLCQMISYERYGLFYELDITIARQITTTVNQQFIQFNQLNPPRFINWMAQYLPTHCVRECKHIQYNQNKTPSNSNDISLNALASRFMKIALILGINPKDCWNILILPPTIASDDHQRSNRYRYAIDDITSVLYTPQMTSTLLHRITESVINHTANNNNTHDDLHGITCDLLHEFHTIGRLINIITIIGNQEYALLSSSRSFLEFFVLPGSPWKQYINHRLQQQTNTTANTTKVNPSSSIPSSPNVGALSPVVHTANSISNLPSQNNTPLPKSMNASSSNLSSGFAGDKRSYEIIFELLNIFRGHIPTGDDDRINKLHGDSSFLSLLIAREQCLLFTAMLHHQLKTINYKHSDPLKTIVTSRNAEHSSSTNNMSNATRFTSSSIEKMLSILTRYYVRLFTIDENTDDTILRSFRLLRLQVDGDDSHIRFESCLSRKNHENHQLVIEENLQSILSNLLDHESVSTSQLSYHLCEVKLDIQVQLFSGLLLLLQSGSYIDSALEVQNKSIAIRREIFRIAFEVHRSIASSYHRQERYPSITSQVGESFYRQVGILFNLSSQLLQFTLPCTKSIAEISFSDTALWKDTLLVVYQHQYHDGRNGGYYQYLLDQLEYHLNHQSEGFVDEYFPLNEFSIRQMIQYPKYFQQLSRDHPLNSNIHLFNITLREDRETDLRIESNYRRLLSVLEMITSLLDSSLFTVDANNRQDSNTTRDNSIEYKFLLKLLRIFTESKIIDLYISRIQSILDLTVSMNASQRVMVVEMLPVILGYDLRQMTVSNGPVHRNQQTTAGNPLMVIYQRVLLIVSQSLPFLFPSANTTANATTTTGAAAATDGNVDSELIDTVIFFLKSYERLFQVLYAPHQRHSRSKASSTPTTASYGEASLLKYRWSSEQIQILADTSYFFSVVETYLPVFRTYFPVLRELITTANYQIITEFSLLLIPEDNTLLSENVRNKILSQFLLISSTEISMVYGQAKGHSEHSQQESSPDSDQENDHHVHFGENTIFVLNSPSSNNTNNNSNINNESKLFTPTAASKTILKTTGVAATTTTNTNTISSEDTNEPSRKISPRNSLMVILHFERLIIEFLHRALSVLRPTLTDPIDLDLGRYQHGAQSSLLPGMRVFYLSQIQPQPVVSSTSGNKNNSNNIHINNIIRDGSFTVVEGIIVKHLPGSSLCDIYMKSNQTHAIERDVDILRIVYTEPPIAQFLTTTEFQHHHPVTSTSGAVGSASQEVDKSKLQQLSSAHILRILQFTLSPCVYTRLSVPLTTLRTPSSKLIYEMQQIAYQSAFFLLHSLDHLSLAPLELTNQMISQLHEVHRLLFNSLTVATTTAASGYLGNSSSPVTTTSTTTGGIVRLRSHSRDGLGFSSSHHHLGRDRSIYTLLSGNTTTTTAAATTTMNHSITWLHGDPKYHHHQQQQQQHQQQQYQTPAEIEWRAYLQYLDRWLEEIYYRLYRADLTASPMQTQFVLHEPESEPQKYRKKRSGLRDAIEWVHNVDEF